MPKNFFKKRTDELNVGEALCYVGLVGAICYAPYFLVATWIEHGDDIKDFCKGVKNSFANKRLFVGIVDAKSEEVIIGHKL